MNIRSKIQSLISAGNEVTGNEDTNLTDVVQALIDGYGQSGTRYTIQWNLVNTTSTSNRTSIPEGNSFTAALTPLTAYEIDDTSVVITMGGVDITQTAYSDGSISIASVTGNISITAISTLAPIDLLNVTWADHAIACGQSTNNYNAWSPHNLQYDDVHDCFVFLQCHCDKHLNGTYTNWTLSIIDPYDATDFENIAIPSYNGLGMLFVENGVWTLLPRGGNVIYQSADRGVTWNTIQASIPTFLFGVYKCGRTYFAGDDYNRGLTYHKSFDLISWESVSFDSSLGYSTLCETTFAEYDGYYWAFNRTNDATLGHPVILRSDDAGETWELFSDQMLHGYRSTVSCYPFKNYLMVADIDRDNGILYYNRFDGSIMETINTWTLAIRGGDDFQNVNIASNYDDVVILEFMAPPFYQDVGSLNTKDLVCDNVMLVGSTKALPALNITYIDTEESLLSYTRSHALASIRGTYSPLLWNASSNTIRTKLPETISDFVDEIELPLNFSTIYSPMSFYVKEGDHYVKPCNNPLLSLNDQNWWSGSSNFSGRLPYIKIKNIWYLVNMSAGKLPILFNANNNLPLSQFTANIITTGKTWQQNLGFRRVLNMLDSSGTESNEIYFGHNVMYQGEHNFVEVNYVPLNVVSISVVFTQGSATIHKCTPLDALRQYLVVTAHYTDGTSEVLQFYTLSGTLTVGTSTITVTYGGKTATFAVAVTDSPYVVACERGSINYTDGSNQEASNRIRTEFIPASEGDTVSTYLAPGSAMDYIIRIYDSQKQFVGTLPRSGWSNQVATSAAITTNGYIRLVMRNHDDSEFTSVDVDGYAIKVGGQVYYLYANND